MQTVTGFLALVGQADVGSLLSGISGVSRTEHQFPNLRVITFHRGQPLEGGQDLAVYTGRAFLNACALHRCGDTPMDSTSFDALDGNFALLRVQADGGLSAATDVFGFGSVFVRQTEPGLAIASHLGFLLPEARPDIHMPGLAAHLAGSTSFDGETPWFGIKRLEAGQVLTVEPGDPRANIKTYSQLADVLSGTDDKGLSDAARLDRFDTLMRQAVAREFTDGGDQATIMLTGGKDSRAIASAWRLEQDVPPQAATYGGVFASDVDGARLLARQMGLRHQRIPYGAWSLRDYAPLIAALGGGAAGLQTAHNLVGFDRFAATSADSVTGFLGDCITGGHLGHPSLGNTCLSWQAAWAPRFKGEMADALGQMGRRLNEKAAAYDGLTDAQRRIFLDLNTRQAGWIGRMFELAAWFGTVRHPFVSRDLIRFLFQQPVEWLADQRLYRAWLDRCAQDFAPERPSDRALSFLTRAATSARRRGFPVPGAGQTADWQAIMKVERAWMASVIDNAAVTDDLKDGFRAALDVPLGPGSSFPPILLAMPFLQLRGR